MERRTVAIKKVNFVAVTRTGYASKKIRLNTAKINHPENVYFGASGILYKKTTRVRFIAPEQMEYENASNCLID